MCRENYNSWFEQSIHDLQTRNQNSFSVRFASNEITGGASKIAARLDSHPHR